MKIVKQSVTLEWITPDAEATIERAGRTCYKSDVLPDRPCLTRVQSAREFIAMILRRGHESVIEHASASFRIVCDRGVSHEIVRHRLCSYSQESTRFCNYAGNRFGNEITVIEPPGLTVEQRADWVMACRVAEDHYLSMCKVDCKPEIARSVLPTCVKTELVMTCNFREWRHFLRLRTAPAAHPQMREVAYAIGCLLMLESPACFEDVVSTEDP
jgi:thymidylate synthase (FAD)